MIGNPSADQILIKKLTEIILANLENENFGPNELARESGLTSRTLSRKLRIIARKSISQLIRETRLKRALEILREEEITISEVAYRVGFSSSAYFNTCFHEFFGCPPGKAIKGNIENQEGENEDIAPARTLWRRVPWQITLFGFSVILLCAIVFYLVSENVLLKSSYEKVSKAGNYGKSIAVLPFNNLSDSTDNQYFIDGVMYEILSDLSKIHDLHVISRTDVEQFRRSNNGTPEIATKLKAAYLVEGSGQKYGKRLRLRIQLIETSRNRVIWAKSYEQIIGEPKDIFNIQSEVARSVASELKAQITPEEKRLISRMPTNNLMAYDYYQRGNGEFAKFPFPFYNNESLNKAEFFYRNALKCDSNFAQAYVGVAYVLWKRWDNDNTTLLNGDRDKYMDSMLVLANKALSLNNQLTEAYLVRGEYYSVKGSAEQALEEWNKALKYNPNDGSPYRTIGGMYEELDLVKSLENLQKAVFFNQGLELTQTLRILGVDYYKAGFPEKGDYVFLEALKLDEDSAKYAEISINSRARTMGDYKKAVEHFERQYKADSTNEEVLLRLGYYNSLMGHDQESLKYYRKYLSVIKSASEYNSRYTRFTRIGYAYLKCGFKKEADHYFSRQIEICKGRLLSVRPGEKVYWLYPLAGIYANMGDKAKAYEYLKAFNQARSFTLEWVVLIKTDPIFNDIRNENEFQKIIRDVEAKYQAEHERVKKWMQDSENKESSFL